MSTYAAIHAGVGAWGTVVPHAGSESGLQMRGVLYAAGIALFFSLIGTPMAIKTLARYGFGQPIRDDGPTTHQAKRGTPTMGGVVIVLATLLGYGFTKLATMHAPTASGLLVLFLMAGMGVVGFTDDFLKVFRQRSLGLRAKAKMVGQWIVAIAFAVMALHFPNSQGFKPADTHLSFVRNISAIDLGAVLFVIWAGLLIAGASNGVNLTDGLDGLATGSCVMVFASYVLIGVWQHGESCAVLAGVHGCYPVRDPLDLAIVAAAVMGACFGFLWWNTSPAKIYMGDTGSLALGGALAGLAICSQTELLLAVLGGLFVIITLSVVIQVTYFKISGGKRVFKMAPLHHHFELVGWAEVTVVVRFWIICGLFCGLGLGVFYAGWITVK
ncbi:phospho-N-acetylmuramoyl-pentapeptide-transferase [Catenulispora subtropica]|uniref:Phospho-N-acetylmuramoyl-pentapeptide-transferase n=2 Tax=Catenulispora subtropica TaxID=450798 RepID=A0ABP5C011_9ACTN